jgi:hypothetical protein
VTGKLNAQPGPEAIIRKPAPIERKCGSLSSRGRFRYRFGLVAAAG